jgi:hypothetical protein
MAAAQAAGGFRERPPPAVDAVELPLVRSALEELLRRPGPKLRDVLIGLDRNVG